MASNQIRVIGNDTATDRMLNKLLTSYLRPSYVEVGENKVCLPVAYQNFAERIRNFEVRDEDVFVVAFPRTGSTWTQEMVWLLANDLDYAGAKELIQTRFPYFELQTYYGDNQVFEKLYADGDSFQKFERRKGARFLKSHLHFELLPDDITSGRKRPKIIYVLRNPKDTCVSNYHLSRHTESYEGSFEDYCELFLADRITYAPFWKHVLGFWERKDDLNVLFIRYKDMKEDHPSVIKKVANFLGKNYSDEQIKELQAHLSFDNAKKNVAVNHQNSSDTFLRILKMKVSEENTYVRAGKQDGYKSVMSKELQERFDSWTRENLKNSDLVIE